MGLGGRRVGREGGRGRERVVEGDGLWGEVGCMREMADALWEGHTTVEDWSAHRHRQTDRHCTKVKTAYPPVLLHAIGGYKDCECLGLTQVSWQTVEIIPMLPCTM